MKTVLYLCYGLGPQVEETIFSLLSALRMSPPRKGDLRYVIYTEHPEAFSDFNVEIRHLSEEELLAWVGDSGYVHRRKTMTIVDALLRFPGAIAFVDCDTYFTRPPEELFRLIGPGRSCLHVKEARLLESGTILDRAISDLVRHASFRDLKDQLFPISPNAAMWNSGVIGIHSDDIQLMREVLNLVDQMSRELKRLKLDMIGKYKIHHVEQFATGLVLEHNNISEARDFVFHYWPEHLRIIFRTALPSLLAATAEKPWKERAELLYSHRPRSGLARRFKQRVRRSLRAAGFTVPGISVSA